MSASVQTPSSEASVAIKKSLCHFINKNVPTADVTMIDDIVLSYVVAIIEEASQDSCFDVEGFIELMISYVPDFMAIDAEQVYNWLVEVEAEIVRLKQEAAEKPDISPSCSMMLPAMADGGPSTAQASKPGRNRNSISESSDDMEEHVIVFECPEYAEQSNMLKDLFPNTCMLEIKHCMSIADGDVQVAAATLLLRRDNGQEITAAALAAPNGKTQIDDVTLKYRIIERYSYVDKNSGKKEHRPLAPKSEPKKLVRYRDGKIVSLKGEKYTEVSKSGAEEENLKKPKKHCP